jgi:hypothetical protein
MTTNPQDFQNMLLLDNYASADFPDSETTRPLETYLETGSQVPATIYSTAVLNALQIQTREIKDKTQIQIQLSNNWKRKIKDIFQRGNDNIFSFLSKPVTSHPTIGVAEQFIRKFSRPEVQGKNPGSLLREILEDISGNSFKQEINDRLKSKQVENSQIQTIITQVKELYEIYRETTEKIGLVESNLKSKLYTLDKIQPRLVMLMELGVNEDSIELQKHIENYLTKVYENNCPEPEYKELLGLYKKLCIVRDLINLMKIHENTDKEPLCSICLNEQVQYVLGPCGHTFCEGCVRKQTIQCYMCRGNIQTRVKLFFC